jgi:hypothetical protein
MGMPLQTTLLDLVRATSRFCDSECEVERVVAFLVNTGQAVLRGSFAGAKIEL